MNIALNDQDFTLYGPDEGDECFFRFGLRPDLNGDSLDDIVFACPAADGPGNNRPQAGELYIIYGVPQGISQDIDLANNAADVVIYGADPSDGLSDRLAIGDINGDGIDDLFIGARGDGPGNTRPLAGEAYIIFGRASSQLGSVVINEIAWSGTAASANDEWIELYNTTSQDIDLTGWTLESTTDGTPSFTLDAAHCRNLVIPAQGFFLLERTDDNTVSDIPADCIYTGSLVNSGESLALKDPSGTVIDTANGDGGAWPAGTTGSGSPPYASMERIDPLAPDTDANWATNNGVDRNGLDANGNPINGTPKALNSTVNEPPVADAGPDQTVNVGDLVQLDGSGSYDPDGDPLSYSWTFISKPAGSSATLSDPSSVNPTFTADLAGEYLLKLTVDDGRGQADSDQTKVTAVMKGDVNGDGKVNVIDARICLRFALGLISLSAEQQEICDVDGDGAVTEADAERSAQFSLGLIEKFSRAGGLAGLIALALVGMLVCGLRLAPQRRRPLKVVALLLLSLGLSAILAGCFGVPAGLFLPKGATGLIADLGPNSIVIRVQNMPDGGLAALEARSGGFTFDPTVIEVKSIQTAPGWRLLASKIDNAQGGVRFAVVNPAAGTAAGEVLTLTIQRKRPGDAKVRWDREQLTLGDALDQEITEYQTVP